jgi:diguanylate cyclase (GGDEF)-like protein
MFLTRLSVSARFLLVLAIGFTFQAGISIVSLLDQKNALMQDRASEVKHLLEVGYSAVVFYHDQAAKGVMTDAEARRAAANALRAMRYDGKNYFCIWDLKGTGIAHGGRPELEGRTFLNSPDAEKNPVVASMVGKLLDVAKSDKKEGAVSYRIPRAGQTIPLDKIAYTRVFEPWGWSISTGAYIDDIELAFRSRALAALWVFIGLIALAGAITFIIGRDLAQAMNRLSRRVTSVAMGELDDAVPDVDRADEVGVMARALMVLRDTSREAAELKLDQLTGLPARKLLMDQLKRAKGVSARSGNYGGLMLIDMDKFKELNDTHGHDFGDMLLREVARRLTASLRDGDTVARLGGDEFVLVVVDIGRTEDDAAAAAEAVGHKLLALLSEPYQLGNLTHTSAASIGITLFKGDDVSADDLLKQADLAMYKSKDSGRNVCRFFRPHMETSLIQRAALDKELRQALINGQFHLYYQPQVGPEGELTGAEALVRWEHPRRGLVLPGEFVPVAEETGLILPLGKWVLETVCKQLAIWATRPATADLRVAVNVSARQFQRPEFVEQVVSTLRSTGANPHRLTLELTESLLVHNVEDVAQKMSELKREGVNFALDDFGTGYSSLYYLKRLPLDQLKIDRSFVRDVLTDPDDAAIAKTIVALAQTLGLEVIAEGIETAAQRAFLASSGCHCYQGNFVSQPLPILNFEQFVSHRGQFKPSPVTVPVGILCVEPVD